MEVIFTQNWLGYIGFAKLIAEVFVLLLTGFIIGLLFRDSIYRKQAKRLYEFKDGFLNGFDSITRVELIDKKGRRYSNWNCSARLLVSDDERTLKVFVEK